MPRCTRDTIERLNQSISSFESNVEAIAQKQDGSEADAGSDRAALPPGQFADGSH
jgi:hypothetical protein